MKRTLMTIPGSIGILVILLASLHLYGQGRGGQRGATAATPREAAPFDITGYWEAIVTEDWRWRMTTPPKGDYAPVPLNAEGRRVADSWDPARDEAADDQCKSYGAPSIMRVPERLHITWQDNQTLKVETDTGMQTRLLYFGPPQGQGGTWQGISQASWDFPPTRTLGGFGGARIPLPEGAGSLKVVTTKLRPGYLRKNGVPYSANAVLTEYYDVVEEPNGDVYLLVTSTVEDPVYLATPYLTGVHFKRQPDNRGWDPTPCQAS